MRYGLSMSDPADKPLILSELTKDASIVALGAVAAKELLIKREAAFFVDAKGHVQIVPIAELLLDAIPEPMAIQEMLKQKITNEGIELYLRGRDARMAIRHGIGV